MPTMLLALSTVPIHAGQITDPKTDFVQALAGFSLELDGPFGDEGSRIWSNLDSMDRRIKEWDATIRTYEAAMTADLAGAQPHEAARMHAALGGIYLNRSRVADALREFVTAGRLDSSGADIFALQGLAYSHALLNEPAAATQAFRKALSLDPRDPVRAYTLAAHLMKVGDLEEARKALRLFEENEKRRAEQPRTSVDPPFIRLGLAEERAGVEPFFPPALYAEGFALLRRGDYAGAILHFKEAASRDPLTTDPAEKTGAMGKAAAAFRDGQVDAAVQHLKVAIELTPDGAEPHRILGRVYLANQQGDKGIAELGAAIRLSPHDERTHLALADALVETGAFLSAERALKETIEAIPGSGRAHYELGRVYQRQGQYLEALHEFDTAVAFGPLLGLNGLYQTIGAINVDLQNFDAAIDAYARRADVHPNDAAAHQDLGRTYVKIGRHDEARAEFAVVLMLNPGNAEAYGALAQVYASDGQYAEAVEAARRALALDPSHQQARYALATSLLRLGNTDEGKRELEAFQRVLTDQAAARSRQIELEGIRGEALLSTADGDYEKAVALLRKALLQAPDSAASHLDLGRALVKAGHAVDAVERFKSAIVLNAPFDVHRDLAEAYAALGRLDESRNEQALYEQMKQESLRRAGANR